MSKQIFCMVILVISTILCADAQGIYKDYKYVRTYNSNGSIIKEADSRWAEYIQVGVSEYEILGHYYKTAFTGLWTNLGNGDWKYTAGNSYGYNSSNNGWDIFVLTIGYHTEYLYVRKDLSVIRWTFMAGGNGSYKEYIRQDRPKIDRLGPTH